jgi:hypothetical protein
MNYEYIISENDAESAREAFAETRFGDNEVTDTHVYDENVTGVFFESDEAIDHRLVICTDELED